jgi:hypothetical protein
MVSAYACMLEAEIGASCSLSFVPVVLVHDFCRRPKSQVPSGVQKGGRERHRPCWCEWRCTSGESFQHVEGARRVPALVTDLKLAQGLVLLKDQRTLDSRVTASGIHPPWTFLNTLFLHHLALLAHRIFSRSNRPSVCSPWPSRQACPGNPHCRIPPPSSSIIRPLQATACIHALSPSALARHRPFLLGLGFRTAS